MKLSEAKGKRGRRFGKPKTEKERKETHKKLFGDEKLPPRGTRKKVNEEKEISDKQYFVEYDLDTCVSNAIRFNFLNSFSI